MLVLCKLSDLPISAHNLEFEFAHKFMHGGTAESGIYRMDTELSLSPDALIAGNLQVRSPDGFPCSVLDNGAEVLVDVEADAMGIFVGGVCIALATDLSDEHGRWYYWKYNAQELLNQALAAWNS